MGTIRIFSHYMYKPKITQIVFLQTFCPGLPCHDFQCPMNTFLLRSLILYDLACSAACCYAAFIVWRAHLISHQLSSSSGCVIVEAALQCPGAEFNFCSIVTLKMHNWGLFLHACVWLKGSALQIGISCLQEQKYVSRL